MAIKPILFNKQISTEMVRAILDGRKTCTRRLVSSRQFLGMLPDKCKNAAPDEFLKGKRMMFKPYCDMTDAELIMTAYKAPYQPGDIMYVRETWQYLYELDGNEQIIEGTGKYYYAATDTIPFDTYVDASGVTHERVPWHPSIHMPKEAARIWLKVTDVRVERLKDMTNNDALKEGAEGVRCDHAGLGAYGCTDCMNTGWLEPPLLEFMDIWNSTIKKSDLDRYGWDANPWVWVIEFERCEKPKEV